MNVITLKVSLGAVGKYQWGEVLQLQKEICIEHRKFIELECMGCKYTISGRTTGEEITGAEFVAAAKYNVESINQPVAQDILTSIIPDVFLELYDLTRMETINLINASFLIKNERYYFVLASALLFSEVFGDVALLDGNMTEEDILQAMKMLKETLGLECKLPVLFEKDGLMKRIEKLTQNEFLDSLCIFEMIYRGGEEAVKEIFYSRVPAETVDKIREYILKGET